MPSCVASSGGVFGSPCAARWLGEAHIQCLTLPMRRIVKRESAGCPKRIATSMPLPFLKVVFRPDGYSESTVDAVRLLAGSLIRTHGGRSAS